MSSIPTPIATALRAARQALQTANGNEAQTRFDLIDVVLFDLLGWTRDDINVEERISEDGLTEFSDYRISTGVHSVIVEAKRANFDFSGMPKSRKALLRGTWLAKPVGDPIRQVRDYGRKQGVGFCVATNGTSWIVFPVNRRDQTTFEDSSALLFPDVSTLLDDDPNEFVDLLSRQAVVAGSLDRALLGSERDQNEQRRLNAIYDRSFSKINRSSIFPHIEREIVAAFSEELLTENPDRLEQCYVTTPERIRFDNRIRMYILKQDPVLSLPPMRPAVNAAKIKASVELERIQSRPIVLLTLGLVGSGKTTFLAHVHKVSSKQYFLSEGEPSPHWIYADFRSYSKDVIPREFIFGQIFEYLKDNSVLRDYKKTVAAAYERELEAIKAGPLAMFNSQERIDDAISTIMMDDYRRVEPYTAKIIRYAARSHPIFLVIDNVDQIEEVDIQSDIFLEATAIARELHANLVLAMRDSTYVKNRNSAVFNAFDFDAVYIEAPRILDVLLRRFDVAEELLEGRSFDFYTETGHHVLVRDSKIVIDLLRHSVQRTEVGKMLEIAATGDTRLALRMTRQFLQYGYSSTSRALETYQKTRRYILPPHEALRAIMLGNQNVYREEFSAIGNPFDAYLGRSELQLLRLFIMTALVAYSSERDFEELSAQDIIDTLEQIGVSQSASEKVITSLIQHRFLFSRSHGDFNRESVMIASRLCGFVTRDLVGRMAFLETTLFDTFIGDEEIWETIKENMKLVYRERNLVTKIGIRREIVIVFFDWLEKQLERLVSEARARGLAPQWSINSLSTIRPLFAADLRRAHASAKFNYGSED